MIGRRKLDMKAKKKELNIKVKMEQKLETIDVDQRMGLNEMEQMLEIK
jgi:hypothetical protein